ncbi:MAG TPA: hypothetical protein VN805_08485 [Caulobacteraceae bacterium]|nr:hypothetical protein [Caulobacteraceae bacterium]
MTPVRRALVSIAVPAVLTLAAAVVWFVTRPGAVAPAAATREPGGEPSDVATALGDPDEYAWRLFFFINRQAAPGAAGVADPGRSIRQYDPDEPVVWETWALASGAGRTQAGSEALRVGGVAPVAWSALPRERWPAKVLSVNLANPDGPAILEVRLNRASYDFIRSGGLYTTAGLEQAYAAAVVQRRPDAIQFPVDAKAVKAVWKDLGPRPPPAVLARYHWRRIGSHVWGLTGLHIVTKDLPTWFWADFEHVDDPIPPGEPSSDTTTRGPGALARGAVDGERRELSGTKWAYYRLRGVQIGFTDARGAPTRLSDAVLERGFEHTSCMTCHARATIGVRDGQLERLNPNPTNFDDAQGRPPAIADAKNSDLGVPSVSLFGKDRLTFLQTDFIWAMALRAPRETLPAGGGR